MNLEGDQPMFELVEDGDATSQQNAIDNSAADTKEDIDYEHVDDETTDDAEEDS